MLQRAASNAYTWWWASNIRTKQTKWLDDDIQDMEERVKSMIKLIEEDADSFAKKAEMYYKRRPELINCVEQTFKAYKSLADRYDRISGELHKANHTIATVCPDQIQLMGDEDDDQSSKTAPTADASKSVETAPHSAKLPKPPPPELPRIVSKNKPSNNAQLVCKKTHLRRVSSQDIPESAKEEIDKLQKGILTLQTEKEFVKSSYEKGLGKYWEIEQQMTEMQEEVSRLQDEFGAYSVIEDDEARALMASTAFKSCEDTLISLREQQKRSMADTQLQSERIKAAMHKLKALKGEENVEATDEEVATSSTEEEEEEEEVGSLNHERLDLQSISDKVKECFERCPNSIVVELVEKIDELVDKTIILEFTVSSQMAQIERLRAETDELHKHLRELEEDKVNPSCDSDYMNSRLKEAEENLQKIQNLERNVHSEKGVLQIHLTEVCHNLNDLSEKLHSPEQIELSETSEKFTRGEDVNQVILEGKRSLAREVHTEEMQRLIEEGEDGLDWEQLLVNGIEGREKIVIHKFVAILRKYKETRKMLTEIDKKNQECHSETMQQIQELRNANAIKDEEIKTLRQRVFSSDSEVVYESNSIVEDKFRANIDNLLEENLDFWLRFSTSYHQIQKFDSTFKELQAEFEKTRDARNIGHGINSLEQTMRQDSTPIEKKLRELNSELQVWLERNGLLQGELRCRFASLCNIREEITKASESSEEGVDPQFTPYQSAKFQGEVINMQHENDKVAKELQSGLDHVRGLQVEIGRTLLKLHECSESPMSKGQHHPISYLRHLSTKSRIPLRTFLFGRKPKKPSLFSCMNPTYQKQYSDLQGGLHRQA